MDYDLNMVGRKRLTFKTPSTGPTISPGATPSLVCTEGKKLVVAGGGGSGDLTMKGDEPSICGYGLGTLETERSSVNYIVDMINIVMFTIENYSISRDDRTWFS